MSTGPGGGLKRLIDGVLRQSVTASYCVRTNVLLPYFQLPKIQAGPVRLDLDENPHLQQGSGGRLALFRFKACTKCGGDLALDDGDWLCLQCGKYYYVGLYRQRDRDRSPVRWEFPKTRGFGAKDCTGGSCLGSREVPPMVYKIRTGAL